jgi:DNA-binding winged helix-turn-helix (wHTH) protein
MSRMPSGAGFAFGPYQLDTGTRRLTANGTPVQVAPRQVDLLRVLVAAAGMVVSKDRLIETGWAGIAVGDSSVEKQIAQLRQLLDAAHPHRFIETVPRAGYRFVETVTPVDPARAEVNVTALLAPHRAFIEGRAALETLERTRLGAARETFDTLVRHNPGEALFHVGLANACVLQFEATRAAAEPDIDALRLAAAQAHEACRLGPDLAEVWATLGFVLERTGDRVDAQAALQRAVSLEPDNWLHLFRQAAGTWGEARYRAARRTLAQYAGFPMAHLLAATVKVARGALDAAEQDIDAALAVMANHREPSRFSPVAVHWLKGLLCLARGADADAMAAFERELALESHGHLYAAECCANTRSAMGARHLGRGDLASAGAAFREAIARVPRHPLAHAGLAILSGRTDGLVQEDDVLSVDAAVAQGARLVAMDDAQAAARLVARALEAAPPGNAGWLIPIEPLLRVREAPDLWKPVLQLLCDRAA